MQSKSELIDLLRLADKAPQFSRFFDLPPELRTKIYQFYCSSFADDPLTIPTYPPPARANKTLRTEVLPVFHSCCTFSIGLQVDSPWRGAIPHVLRMQRETSLFFKSLTREELSHVQKLEVALETHDRVRLQETFKLLVEVPRNGKQVKARISVLDRFERPAGDAEGMLHPWGGERIGAGKLRELEGRVARFAEGIQRRGQGGNHLVIGDVYRIRSMLETFFEEDLLRSRKAVADLGLWQDDNAMI